MRISTSLNDTYIYPEHLRARFVKGLGANFLSRILNLARRILLVPLFLVAWGVDVYGEWLILSSIVSCLYLSDLGGQLYIVNRLTQTFAKQDIIQFRRILHTGLVIFIIIPSVVFIFFMIAILLFPLLAVLHISTTDNLVVVVVLAILSFQFVFSLPQGILLGVYRAVGMLPRGVMLGNLIVLLQLIFLSIGLLLKLGMIWIAFLQIVRSFIIAIIALVDLNRKYPAFKLTSLKDLHYNTGLGLVKPSLHFFSIQLAQIISTQGTLLVVGGLLGPVQVVIFSTLRTIANTIWQLLGVLTMTAWPELTRLDIEQKPNELLSMFRAILRTTILISCFFIIVFYYFGHAIYSFWLQGAVIYNKQLMELFLVYVFQLAFWTSCSTLLMAINKHSLLSKIILVSSMISLGVSYIGGTYYGINGILISMISVDLLIPFWLVPYLLSKYNDEYNILFFIKELLPPLIVLMIVIYLPWTTIFAFVLILFWWMECLPVEMKLSWQ